MSKKSWLLLIFAVTVIGYFIASKINPAVDPWIVQNIFTPIGNGITGTVAAITNSPTWQTWITPNIGWIALITGFIGGLFTYRWATHKKLPWQKAKAPAFQPQTGPPPITSTYVPPPPSPQPTSTPPPIQAATTDSNTYSNRQPTTTSAAAEPKKKEEAAAAT